MTDFERRVCRAARDRGHSEAQAKKIARAAAKLVKLGFPDHSAMAMALDGAHGNKRDPKPKKAPAPKYIAVRGRVVKVTP